MGTKNTSNALEEVNKKDTEGTLENEIYSLENVKSGSGKGGNGSNGNNSKNGSNGSRNGDTTADESLKRTASDFNKEVKNSRAATNKYNDELAKQKNVDTKTGQTETGYNSLSKAKKEKTRAKENLKRAENENKLYQGWLSDKDSVEKLTKDIGSGFKKGYDNYDSEALQKELQDATSDKEYWQRLADSGDTGDEKWSFDESLGSSKEYQEKARAAEEKIAEIQENIKNGEAFKNNLDQFHDLMKKQGDLLGWQIDEYGKWASKAGTPKNKYQAEIAENLFGKLNQIYEDGKVTQDEMDAISSIYDDIDNLAKEERLADENIQEAERKYDSADAKFSYFLLDQIKSLAAFIMGMSQGNPQMIYSAMEQFNKKISDAEAGFTTNRLNAFSSNDVKETTGMADAQYAMEQIIPEIDKAILDGKIKMADRARAVEGLEMAFTEYKRYMAEGGHDDFAAWFASQQSSGNDWVSVIKMLVGAGALNWDSLKGLFGGEKSDTDTPAPKGKKGAFLDPKSILNTSGKFTELAKNVLENGMKQSEETKIARDKANTVGNALASRLGGRGAAPQGTGNAAPVNTSWGNA